MKNIKARDDGFHAKASVGSNFIGKGGVAFEAFYSERPEGSF